MTCLRNWTKRLSLASALVLAGIGSVAANDDTGQAQQPFRIGMVVGDTPVVEGLSAIQAMFSQALGLPVEVVAARDYEALIHGQIGGRLDYAIYSAAAYAAASIRCECLEPVVSPVDSTGAIGLRSILLLRPGAPPERIATGPRDSLAATLAPMALWPGDGAAGGREALIQTESLAEAETMFVKGGVDAFFGWMPAWPDGGQALVGGTPERLEAAGLEADDYEIGWRSDILRYGPHAVRSDIAPERLDLLRRLLVEIGGRDPDMPAYLANHYGGGFVAAAQGDYAAVIEAVAALSGRDAGE
ncbi:PhnD/SsuA/transferrin family substrate-binding protein [Mesorhizobium sp. CAU 1741]|uniref:PhnD/SsuA/transferrin family substrate-binding protein n=1 Tax=Mesorhizobium sp. CAU 1741 TaxID=3140366 RepID=UPI00325B8289